MYTNLITSFTNNKNPEQAVSMSAYMKDKFLFLGIPKPKRELLQSDFIKQAKKQKLIDWNFIFDLWNMPEREFQYLALEYLVVLKTSLQKTDIDNIKILIINKSWWDTVDYLASTVVGELCSKYPEVIQSHMLNWSESDYIWLARTSILFQLKYKEKTDTELLSMVIRKNCDTKEFFLNKAIGWALREYSKTNKEWVKTFLENNTLHSLSVREASKYLT